MDSNDNPQGGPAPASPSTEAEDTGSRREPGISRPLGSDSSFPQAPPRQPMPQVPAAPPREAPASRTFTGTKRPAEQEASETRPTDSTASARPSAAVPRGTAEPTAGSDTGSPGSQPPPRQPPPGSPDDDGSDDDDGSADPPDGNGKKKRTWKTWLLTVMIALIVIAASVLGVWYFTQDDGSDGDVVTEPPPTEVPAADFCRHGGPASLDEVRVLRFSDKLEGRINPLWSDVAKEEADAQTVLDGIVTELFSTEGDGCTPQGAAYWRLVRPVSIDAGRIGVDDFDSATRMAIYGEDADTATAVAVETASQLSDCADPQFVYLSAEEAPVIYVAAYTVDYDDVVFVRTPLPEYDELPDGSQGLKVLRCSFGKVEGADGDYVSDVLISPTLRAIIYLDSPAGVEVVDIVPSEGEGGDSSALSDEETSETDDTEAADGEDAAETDETASSDDEEASETDGETPETEDTQSDSDPEATDEKSTADEEEAETATDKTPRTDEESEGANQTEEAETKTEGEEEEQPEGKVTTEAEEESKADEEAGEDADEKVVGEEQPEGGSGDGCDGTCGEDDTEPEPEKGDGSGDDCDDDCPGEGDGSGDDCTDDCPGEGDGSGDDCVEGDCPGDGPGSGDDCENGDCPGEGGGDDCQGDDCPGEGGDCEGDDCPGDGDCEGDDCPDEEEVTEPCPEGWLLDPFDNCKAPDPGPDGF